MAIERGKSASTKNGNPRTAKKVTPSAESIDTLEPNQPQASAWTYTRRGYAIAQSFRQLSKRKLASLSTLLVFGITLALPALILFTANSLAALGNKSVGEESITAYLSLQTSDLEGATLSQQLQSQPGIKSRDTSLKTRPWLFLTSKPRSLKRLNYWAKTHYRALSLCSRIPMH